MKKVNAHCYEAGTLQVGTSSKLDAKGTDHSGALAAYQFETAASLHRVAVGYSWVVRPNGREIKGSVYTIRMAKNDFLNA
jgi:hypothetical protein